MKETEDNSDSECEEEDTLDYAIPLHFHRFPCLAHTLQLILKDVKKIAGYATALGKARNIVKTVRISSVATENMLQKCGKTGKNVANLVYWSYTRLTCNSNMFVLERISASWR